jgi:polyphosphate kinase
MEAKFIDRDISWLYFNERVLGEAKKESTPLLERMKFLAIYSSNLDEFFRVRIPMIYGKRKIIKKNKTKGQVEDSQTSAYKEIKQIIRRQQKLFGKILVKSILPKLREEGIILNYGNKIPEFAIPELRKHFQVNLASYIHIVDLKKVPDFFPLNNQIYFYCTTKEENAYIIKIPSENTSRFKVIHHDGYDYVFFYR